MHATLQIFRPKVDIQRMDQSFFDCSEIPFVVRPTTISLVVGPPSGHKHKDYRQAIEQAKEWRMWRQDGEGPLQQNASPTPPPRQSSRGSPIAQCERSQLPDALRPAASALQRPQYVPPTPEPLNQWTQRLPTPGRGPDPHLRRVDAQRIMSRQRRPPNVTVREPTAQDVSDVRILYPQLSPYADPTTLHRSYDPPTPIQRSVSQPYSPTWRSPVSPLNAEDFQSMAFPQAPAYPTSTFPTRRRLASANAASEADTLQDTRELQMFAEASAGLLEPEQMFRPAPYQWQQEQHMYSSRAPANIHSDYGTLQTPTTVSALHQLAGMPGDRQYMQASRHTSNVELWLETASSGSRGPELQRAQSSMDVSPIEEEHPPDDELPDYATSQAEAAARARREAALRAQELQRRWRESGARRGL